MNNILTSSKKCKPPCFLSMQFCFAFIFALSFLAKAQAQVPCTGIDSSGDFSYAVYTHNDTVHFTFFPLAPIAGSNLCLIYIKQGNGQGAYPGYNMTDSSADFIFKQPVAAGTVLSFYFTYDVPAGGQRNSSARPVQYVAGSVCYAGAPAVTITSPAEAASFTSPANIAINATAADTSGIAKVEFYQADSLLGTAVDTPYTFTWTNVSPGAYSLTAKATNMHGLATVSIPVDVTVKAANTDGYCGTSVNKDYEYKADTANGQVVFTFHPLKPIQGCSYALIYIKAGAATGYGGYGMSAAGTDFVYTASIPVSTLVSFYFTYDVPSGGERNSSLNPESYVVGANCTGITAMPPAITITSPGSGNSFTEPATIAIKTTTTDTSAAISRVDFYNGNTYLGSASTAPFNYSWNNVPAGNYVLSAKATASDSLTGIAPLVNIVVGINNSQGFCGTLDDSDFSYRAETINGNVVVTFHPLAPIAGCAYVYIYVRQGASGAYPGYAMTKIGSDFQFVQANAKDSLSIYFTYNVPSGGERNSSATPQSYIVGSVCLTGSLPVQLLSYTASVIKGDAVLVTWSTAKEVNNSYFLVQKSPDGITFETFAKVPAGSVPGDVNKYSATDVSPIPGANFYRLTQVDKDGTSTDYGVKVVTLDGNNGVAYVYPNPLTGKMLNVKVSGYALTTLNWQLITIEGKALYAGTIAGGVNDVKLLLPAKPAAGVYFLKIDGNIPLKLVVY